MPLNGGLRYNSLALGPLKEAPHHFRKAMCFRTSKDLEALISTSSSTPVQLPKSSLVAVL